MSVKVEGITKARTAYKMFPRIFERNIEVELGKQGNILVKNARRDHRYKRKSGNLDRAIQSSVKNLTLLFWINPQLVTSGKYNYGIIQHEGSGKNYQYSGLTSKRYTTKLKHGGVKADHFMLRAWNRRKNKIKQAMIKTLKKTTKSLGF